MIKLRLVLPPKHLFCFVIIIDVLLFCYLNTADGAEMGRLKEYNAVTGSSC